MSDIVKKLREMQGFVSLSGATKEQIEQAEKSLNLKFADEYCEYLAAFGVASACGHELTGICASPRLNAVGVTISEKMSNPAVPANWYVVEQAHVDGIVVWQSGTGEVWQTAPNTPPIKLCASLCEYFVL